MKIFIARHFINSFIQTVLLSKSFGVGYSFSLIWRVIYGQMVVGVLNNLPRIEKNQIWEHVSYLYLTRNIDNQDLGYIDRESDRVYVTLPNDPVYSLEISQSLSQLSSNSSSTGFVCWKTGQLVVDWIVCEKKCPFYQHFQHSKDLDVLELGAGVNGVSGSILGPLSRRYVCSDQKPLLKLLKQNILENATGSFNSSSLNQSSSKTSSTIEVVEFDWEFVEKGLNNYYLVTENNNRPDLVVAFDTIYNEYLIEPFLHTLSTVMAPQTVCVLGIHMRDDITLESFLHKTIQHGFNIRCVPSEMLTDELKKGFVIYILNV